MTASALLDARRILPISLGANWIYALPSSDPSSPGVLLIDAGPDYDGAWDALVAQLHAAGLDPADVRTVLITHAHIDHCGLARRWQQAGAEVLGSAAEVDRFLLGDRVVRFQSDLVFRFLLEAGVPGDRLEHILRRRPGPAAPRRGVAKPRERWPGFLRGARFQPDRELQDGDLVTLGDRRVRFVAAPGHTPGNAVYVEEATGSLFSGDQLLPHITPNPGIHFVAAGGGARTANAAQGGSQKEQVHTERFRSLPAYTRSLERIATLGTRHLYPGHGEPCEVPVDAAIDRTLTHHAKRQQRVLRFLRDGPLTPYDVLLKFFPHLPDARLWQAMAEVIGHIDALVERGEVVEGADKDGTVRLSRSA